MWDAAAFSSIFLALSFPCFRVESMPAHTQMKRKPLGSVLFVGGRCGTSAAKTGPIAKDAKQTMR